MGCSRTHVVVFSVGVGFLFGVFLLYSILGGLKEPRTRFVHRFHPPPDRQLVNYEPTVRRRPPPLDRQRKTTTIPPLPPLPPEPPDFPKLKPYTSFLSRSSSYTKIEDAYYQRMTSFHVRCSPMPHLGRDGDGGWETCLAKSFRPEQPCLVYDFGVNNVWEFDEVMARSYGCTVRAFDPSMGRSDFMHIPGPVHFYRLGLAGSNRRLRNGWRLWTMRRVMKRFGEYLRTIDVLKIDIEYYEWGALEHMLSTGILGRTKQLLFEAHTHDVRGRAPSKDQLLYYHRVLDRLEAAGFRRFYSHANPLGKGALARARGRSKSPEKKKSAHLDRTCCYELYYINTNFAKDMSGLKTLD